MDEQVKFLNETKINHNTFSKQFKLFTFLGIFATILYLIFSINWKNTGKHIEYVKIHLDNKIGQLSKAKEIIGQLNEKTYRLNTKSCKISDLPLYDDETRKLFKNVSETIWPCKHKRMVKVKRLDETWIKLDWNGLGYIPSCYHRKLSRGKDDNSDFYGKFIGPMNETAIALPDHNFVHIVCYKNTTSDDRNNPNKNDFNTKDPQLIHNEIIPMIPFVNKTSDSDVPNVLLMAIDATSYVNFKRHFIRTEKFLNKNKFYELRGYNKVGANTFPNMIPFLTGHHSEEIVSDDKLNKIYFDDWPIVWKKYSDKGFVTAFLEEMSWCGLFHYNRLGFKRQPTDYQLRPFHMQIAKQKYNYYCYNDRTETETCLDWTYEYVSAMNKRHQKYFAYISISEMTHDWIEAGHYMDVPYNEILMKLFNEKLLNNTLLIFFSDHGFRYGPLRETHTGEVENRLPFIFIHLPENFDPKYAENLRQNQYRLTTPFDIHASLTHLIQGEPDHSLPHGLSLFADVIPENRTCNSSSIPEMYCSCYEDNEIKDFEIIHPNNTLVKIVEKINSFTSKVRSKCAKYELHSIHKLYNRSVSRTDAEYKLGDSQIFIAQVYVNPGMALFETVIRSFKNNTKFEIIGEIIRINIYGSQSDCISDKLLKNYCFCK